MRLREPLYQAIHINRTGEESFQDQLVRQFRVLIRSGALLAGARLPSTRTLAGLLGISRSVTQAAFLVLHAEGLVDSRQGSGTYVSAGPGPQDGQDRTATPPQPVDERRVDLAPDLPSLDGFPRAAWRSVWRQACHQAPEVARDPAGELFLRAAIALFLRSSRGIACQPSQVIVAGRTEDAVQALARAVLGEGGAVAVEEPGLPLIRAVLGSRGVPMVPATVDEQGVDLRSAAGGARHAVVSPSHQAVLGVRLSRDRRSEVLAWVRERDGILMEHDRGNEHSYRTAPLPALFSMAGPADRVVYHGSLGGFAPFLPLDYLVLSPEARRRWPAGLDGLGGPVPWIVQRAAERLLAEGHVTRLARRMQPVYEQRRDAVQRALGGLGTGFRLLGASTGEHAALLLPPHIDAARVAAALRQRGIDIHTVNDAGAGGTRNGLLIGYRHLSEVSLHRALRALVPMLREQPPVSGEAIDQAG